MTWPILPGFDVGSGCPVMPPVWRPTPVTHPPTVPSTCPAPVHYHTRPPRQAHSATLKHPHLTSRDHLSMIF